MKTTLAIAIAAAMGAGAAFAGEASENDYATKLYSTKGLTPPGAWFHQTGKTTSVAVFKSGEKKAMKPAKKEHKPTIGVFKSGERTEIRGAAPNQGQLPDIWSVRGMSRPGERFSE